MIYPLMTKIMLTIIHLVCWQYNNLSLLQSEQELTNKIKDQIINYPLASKKLLEMNASNQPTMISNTVTIHWPSLI